MKSAVKPEVLLVDDNERFLDSLQREILDAFVVRTARSLEVARTLLSPPPDAIMLDLVLDDRRPNEKQGLVLLKEIVEDTPHIPVLVMTGYGDVETAVRCIRLGAADFIEKGSDLRKLRVRLEKALENARLSRRVHELERNLRLIAPQILLGDSQEILSIRQRASAAAEDGNITVLITGETGTGKEVVARSIHALGPRTRNPFIDVAVSALPESALEAELFGFERGAFTGAEKRHRGYIERSHSGCLFLDEIGELTQMVQVKLLRFLEQRTIVRIGGEGTITIDAQVIAATNADLTQRTQNGQFRSDLLFFFTDCKYMRSTFHHCGAIVMTFRF